MANLDIATVQADIKAANHNWVAAANALTALPPDRLELYLGYVPGDHELSLEAREAQAFALASRARVVAVGAVGAPASFDWRNNGGNNYVTAVRNQGACGSCVAFGTIATVEATIRVTRQNPGLAIDLSEAHLFYCIARSQGRVCGPGGNAGWWVEPALKALHDVGAPDEACYPYTAGDQNCTNRCADWESRAEKVLDYANLTTTSAMKEWISSKGPVVACFSVYNDFFAYSSGVYKKTASAVFQGGHCVSVVGYDDAAGCWICKNSWGAGWGDSGFFRIAYGEVGIDANMWGVMVSQGPTPAAAYVPMYRYWNGGAGDHFYTTSWDELRDGNHGWGSEGVQCFVSPEPRPGLVSLHRYWNPSIADHFYTTSWDELGGGNHGWGYEGIQCYVAPTQLPGTVPLHRYWNPSIGDHFYTTNWDELGGGNHGWGYEGIQCYVWTQANGASFGDVPATFRTSSASTGSAPAPNTFRPGAARAGMVPSPTFSTSRSRSTSPSSFTLEKTPGGKTGCGCDGGGLRIIVDKPR
jgi:hypothetical protein